MEMLRQEFIAGIVLCLIGLCLLLIPNKIWEITEKWKTKGGEQPSKSYVVIMRALGVVFIVVGGFLVISGLS